MQNKKTVYTTGCFDILHKGHIKRLKKIKEVFPKHKLVIGLQQDKRIREGKGFDRPIENQDERMELVDSIKYVDFVFLCPLFQRKSVTLSILEVLRPDNFITVDKLWEKHKDKLKKTNTKLIFQRYYPYQSTTKIIDKIVTQKRLKTFIDIISKDKNPEPNPKVIMLVGLSGAGKTTISKTIQDQNPNYITLNRDLIESFFDDLISDDFLSNNRMVGKIRRQLVNNLLQKGYSLILDFCHVESHIRKHYEKLCKKHKSTLLKIYVTCDEAILMKRLNQRDTKTGKRFTKLYGFQKKIFTPDKFDFTVDTSQYLKTKEEQD
ncbi:MAG: adenylyltransferase/cytidyltransferase family protein [Candidatus Aenigmarchaeota archaeon]|nr:adenylyltransferase/cytidyltransferase family protein [Candidatus Aenigmarchaeota archaeon]